MRSTIDSALTPRSQRQLYLLTGLVLLPHTGHLPLIVTLLLATTMIWRLISHRFPGLQPGRLILMLLTAASIALVYSQHQTLLGKEAGVSLLTLMLALKTLEVRRRRDLYVTVYIAYFVVVTQFLFDQSFTLLIYLLVLLVGHTSLLLEINRFEPPKGRFEAYRETLRITLQALPIAVVLFILFPRLNQPIWQFGLDEGARTGLSDLVSPGSVSRLTQSSEVAFRVSFEQTPPPREARYWRALVLWDTDGRNWFNDPQRRQPVGEGKFLESRDPVSYEIFVEPHRKRWLFALDLPGTSSGKNQLSQDFLLSLPNPVTRALRYTATSFIQYRTAPPTPAMRQRALNLPDNITRRQRELVARWRRQARDDARLIAEALDFYHRNEFVYTLNPPLYNDNPVDQFLFGAREGFCEHYATAFTQLMRIAGIPARLVVGYQGGEFNPFGDYFTLHQYDAHAWSEVWLSGRGWVRIDPTQAVAPERIRSAINPRLGDVGEPALFRLDKQGFVASGLRRLSLLLDTTHLQWRRWVLGYSREEQFGLMQELGFDFLPSGEWGLLTVGGVALIIAILAGLLLWQGRTKRDSLVVLYGIFCRRMATVALARDPYEGPLDYSNRLCRQRPDLAARVRNITGLYIRLRYGRYATTAMRREFASQVRRFRPRRR